MAEALQPLTSLVAGQNATVAEVRLPSESRARLALNGAPVLP